MFRHELDGPAVMKTVCKLDQHNAYIVVQGKKDSLEILRLHALLLCLVFVVKDSLDLCKTFDQSGDLVVEKASKIIYGIVGVFDNIMKQSGDNGLVAKADIADDNLCDSNRMENIWLPGASPDSLMRFVGKIEGFLYDLKLFRVAATSSGSFL